MNPVLNHGDSVVMIVSLHFPTAWLATQVPQSRKAERPLVLRWPHMGSLRFSFFPPLVKIGSGNGSVNVSALVLDLD
jgi:hypothetical protein